MDHLSIISQQLKNDKVRNILEHGVKGRVLDIENCKRWVNAQHKINKRLGAVADAIIKTNVILTYQHIKRNIEDTIQMFFNDCSSDYIIISEQQTKSGYLFTLLWIYLCDINGFRRPVEVIMSDNQQTSVKGDITAIVINDMDYSGNSMSTFLDIRSRNINKVYIIRAFTTKNAIDRVTDTYSNNTYELIFCIGDVLPGFKDSLIESYGKEEGELLFTDANRFWGGIDTTAEFFFPVVHEAIGHTNILLEYKLADAPSTLLYVYLLGVVPTRDSYPNETCEDESDSPCIDFTKTKFNELQGPESYNLIQGCDANQKEAYAIFKNKFGGDLRKVINNSNLLQEVNRCPKPWYKKINWDTGLLV